MLVPSLDKIGKVVSGRDLNEKECTVDWFYSPKLLPRSAEKYLLHSRSY